MASREGLPDPASGVCFIFDSPADLSKLEGAYPVEEYADCWRGMLFCMAEPATHPCDGGYARRGPDS